MKNTHPFIRPYRQRVGTIGYYINDEIKAAEWSRAPLDAVASKNGPSAAKTPEDWWLLRDYPAYFREETEKVADVTVAELLASKP